ncbi:hypothetical protein [Sphingobium cupriresistens]|uniref:Uncharacterized protein n=1 Tax=Sphingobium cupriresistens TaxID=1132417 RepID=A0A8G1ZEF4_9SPHN|nr:hypothetical protein [Sphingobium cupriresistens]RYM08003.1 hypothetical protein EWH12_17870 [Sphingobium cupriresistens]
MTDNTTPTQDLRSALEPFALEAANYDDNDGEPDFLNAPDGSRLDEFHDLTVGQLRAARKAWSSSGHALAENADGPAGDPFSDANMLRSIARDCERWPNNSISDGAPTSADTLREIAARIEAAQPAENEKGGYNPLAEPLRRALLAGSNLLSELEAHQDMADQQLEVDDQAIVEGAKQDMAWAEKALKRHNALGALAENDADILDIDPSALSPAPDRGADDACQPSGDVAAMREARDLVYRIEAAGALEYEAVNFERWKETARRIAPSLRALPLPSQEVEPAADDGDGRVSITREMFDFLCGAGSLEGYHFGDKHKAERGTWWWRKRLHAMAQAAYPTSAGEGEQLRIGWWNDMKARGVSDDAAILTIQAALAPADARKGEG